MKPVLRFIVSALIFSTLFAAAAQTPVPGEATPTPTPVDVLVPEVINTFPHDINAYTQGLLLHDGYLYESTGLEGQSTLRKVDLETGEVLQSVDQAPDIFSEGLALVDDRLIQLTWKHEIAFVYDLETFEQLDIFSYEGEGWGLCYDGEVLWLSNGTETLTAYDPDTYEPLQEVVVTYQGYPVSQVATSGGRPFDDLNELECVGESIYANIWLTDYIARIDKATGQITGLINAANLLASEVRESLAYGATLNGIAYNPESDTFYVTGKLWPELFEVRFVVPPAAG